MPSIFFLFFFSLKKEESINSNLSIYMRNSRLLTVRECGVDDILDETM